MKKCLLFAGLLITSLHTFAQDEGVIVKRDRIGRDNGIFITLGPSFTLGKNIGDYKAGINAEVGYLKRVNRILSIGPSVSYINFKYDQKETGLNNAFIGGPYRDNEGYDYHQGVYFGLEGGDLSLISLALNLKLNFVPIKDKSKISVYAFAKPFIAAASRTEVTGTAVYLENYGDINSADDWSPERAYDWKAGAFVFEEFTVSDKLKDDTEITGGIFVGPGIEFFPASRFTGFVQVSIGYTLPVTYVSTKAYENSVNYGNDLNVLIEKIEEYPMYKKGFPSVNVQFGFSYNF